MSSSKLFKGKDCAYCAKSGTSTTGDHVVARAFFLEEDRPDLPKVPACAACNNLKSALENYVSATLLIGSRHIEGDRVRRDMVKRRLDKNAQARRQLNLDAPPHWISVNGVHRPMHLLKLDAHKINRLMQLIVVGLYNHHFGRPLGAKFRPDVTMFHPDGEARMWAKLSEYFPSGTPHVSANLGRDTFVYTGAQSPALAGLSVWQMRWHGGITLYGEGAPPQGISHWWGVTRPTEAALAEATGRLHRGPRVDQLGVSRGDDKL